MNKQSQNQSSSLDVASYLADPSISNAIEALEELGKVEYANNSQYKIRLSGNLGDGFIEKIRYNKDFEITVENRLLKKSQQQEYVFHDHIIILYASISCHQTISITGIEPIHLQNQAIHLINIPPETKVTFTFFENHLQRKIYAIFQPESFKAILNQVEYGKNLETDLNQILNHNSLPGIISTFHLDKKLYETLTESMENHSDGISRSLLILARMYEILSRLLPDIFDKKHRSNEKQFSQRDEKLAVMAYEILKKGVDKPLNVTQIAQALATNPNKLRNSFKLKYGITMAQFFKEYRMCEAQRLLMTSNLTISQISEKLGYRYTGEFSVAFGKHFGITPKRYRKVHIF